MIENVHICSCYLRRLITLHLLTDGYGLLCSSHQQLTRLTDLDLFLICAIQILQIHTSPCLMCHGSVTLKQIFFLATIEKLWVAWCLQVIIATNSVDQLIALRLTVVASQLYSLSKGRQPVHIQLQSVSDKLEKVCK